MPTFEVKAPVGANQITMKKQIRDAVAEATRRGKLRPNSVDSLTGENSGNNLGPGTPIIHFDQWENDDEIEVKLILKGGGCENMNAQDSLPQELPNLGRADRSLEGVRKCILHAVWNAQGKGCAPGAIGVCIGGDRTSGYVNAKEQLFRTLDDLNSDPRLADLEASIMGEVNRLGIGTSSSASGGRLVPAFRCVGETRSETCPSVDVMRCRSDHRDGCCGRGARWQRGGRFIRVHSRGPVARRLAVSDDRQRRLRRSALRPRSRLRGCQQAARGDCDHRRRRHPGPFPFHLRPDGLERRPTGDRRRSAGEVRRRRQALQARDHAAARDSRRSPVSYRRALRRDPAAVPGDDRPEGGMDPEPEERSGRRRSADRCHGLVPQQQRPRRQGDLHDPHHRSPRLERAGHRRPGLPT